VPEDRTCSDVRSKMATSREMSRKDMANTSSLSRPHGRAEQEKKTMQYLSGVCARVQEARIDFGCI
jgi:hypothetical protein